METSFNDWLLNRHIQNKERRMIIRFELTDYKEDKGQYVECKISDDDDFDKFMETIKRLCVAHGLHPNTVNRYFGEEE